MFDVVRARRETPGCEAITYLNNAAASLHPTPVREAVLRHLCLEDEVGAYQADARAKAEIASAYQGVATLLGCAASEIAFTDGSTRAWSAAFHSVPLAAGQRILTARAEYCSNYIMLLRAAERYGVQIEPIPSDDAGQLSLEALEEMIDERVALIAVTHVPTNGGLVNPAAGVGAIARRHGILYLLDACQSVGQMPVDVNEIGCDMLSAAGRKYLRGPRGTGFLYVRTDALDRLRPESVDMWGADWVARDAYRLEPHARRFEFWEANMAARIGLGVAVHYALEWGLESIRDRVTELAEQLRSRLAALPGITVRDIGVERCALITFTVERVESPDVVTALQTHGITTSLSRRSGTLLDMEARGLNSVVRASVHYYNTEQEIDRLCNALTRITAK